MHRGFLSAAGGAAFGLLAVASWAQQEPEAIGVITAVQGTVTAEHESAAPARLAIRHSIQADDMVVTDVRSRVKVLLHDDTLLAMGQRTRMKIDEYLYAPDQEVRRMLVRLEQGTLRTLVGRAFKGLGSAFIVRVGTASVIADAAYCVIWRHEQETGVVNIGTGGAVSLLAEGRVVILKPGYYSIAAAGKPPSPAQPADAMAPPTVRQAIDETEVGEMSSVAPGELAEQEIEEELRACPPGSPPGGICPRKAPLPALPPSTPPAVTSGATRR